ncbi:alpha/beta hydrolase [Nocardioides baekrokdamisoli]|uniref:Alpha/beta hydrolase n=1 Tax=Nocardioides baekrokdamisoli TaxID=1804624 RepID=A0A3G9IFQ4_9ACTN|nr:alpha/beta hydrolase [Nocardioides baekrokdamisoli]
MPVIGPAAVIAKSLAFQATMSLPLSVQRRISGPVIEGDGQVLAADTQLMLMLKKISGEPSVEDLPIPAGRIGMARQAEIAGGVQPIGSTTDHWINGQKARLYVPTNESGNGGLLVFFHGGGFVYGDVQSHDPACRFLAEESGVRILSVSYRLAPEHTFPAAYDDAIVAFKHIVEHADEYGADPKRIGVGGDSAGGNLAAGVALAVGRKCAFQLLIYPVVDFGSTTASRAMFGEGFYLTKKFMDLAHDTYAPADLVASNDPRLSPLFATVRKTTAPAFVATAGFDPLRDEGEAYAAKLAAAGIDVDLERYEGLIHGFFNIVGSGHTARAAVRELAGVVALRLG